MTLEEANQEIERLKRKLQLQWEAAKIAEFDYLSKLEEIKSADHVSWDERLGLVIQKQPTMTVDDMMDAITPKADWGPSPLAEAYRDFAAGQKLSEEWVRNLFNLPRELVDVGVDYCPSGQYLTTPIHRVQATVLGQVRQGDPVEFTSQYCVRSLIDREPTPRLPEPDEEQMVMVRVNQDGTYTALEDSVPISGRVRSIAEREIVDGVDMAIANDPDQILKQAFGKDDDDSD